MSEASSVNVPGEDRASRSGWQLAGGLALTSTVIGTLFRSIIGIRHFVAILAVGFVLPLILAWWGKHWRLGSSLVEVPAAGRVRSGVWFGLGLVGLAGFKFLVVGLSSSAYVPSLNDEWSYLFGAETLPLGRLANPTPPLPEFFDAFHILTTPHWVTRYPPGHPATLAIGLLLGWPPATVVLLGAGTTVWVYALGRELGGEQVGRVAGILCLMAPGMDYLTSSYLSQTTLLFAITGCFTACVRAFRNGSVRSEEHTSELQSR